MNKYFLLLLFISTSLVAQTEKGKFILGASSNFNFTRLKIDDDITANVLFNLETGLFVKDNFAIGLTIPYNLNKTIDESSDYDQTNRSVAFAPTIYYYLGSSKTRPYIVGLAGYGKNKSKYKRLDFSGFDKDNISKNDIFLYELGAGVSNFINDFISIDLYFGYSNLVLFEENEFSFNFFNSSETITTSGFGLSVGFRLFL